MSIPHRSTGRIRTPRAALGGALLLAAVAGCAMTESDARPAAPSPSGKAAAVCRSLHDALPGKVEGEEHTTDATDSSYTAAWGDPAIELRCGVDRPAKLTPGTEEYNPTSEAAEVNGVSWLIEEQDEGYRFTTTDRAAYVEVTVPEAYAPEIGALTDLAKPVRAEVPRTR